MHKLLPLDKVKELMAQCDNHKACTWEDNCPKGNDIFSLAFYDSKSRCLPNQSSYGCFFSIWTHELSVSGMPFGYFRDYSHLSSEEIYEVMAGKVEAERYHIKSASRKSAVDLWVDHVPGLYEEYHPSHEEISDEKAIELFSIRIWHSIRGIAGEFKVHDKLKKQFANDKEHGYKEAPNQMEKMDVDGLIFSRSTGETIYNVSIKCGGALSPKFLKTLREEKSLTMPDYYVGLDGYGSNAKLRIISKDKILA